MSDYQVTCITKPNVNSNHESITHLGGPNGSGRWYDTKDNVISFIDNNKHRFFTRVNNKVSFVYVVRESGKKPYLRTGADGYYNNNLLALNQCSL